LKVQSSPLSLDYKSGLAALAALFILLCDTWALAGIFNDQLALFRYMNYFGYYIPLLVLAVVVMATCMVRGLVARVVLGMLSLPALLMPYALSSFSFSGSKWALEDTVKGSEISVVSFSKMSRNKDYSRLSELLDCSEYDVILMQEAPDFDTLIAKMPQVAQSCNYSFAGGDYKSLVLLTRFPILSSIAYRTHNTFAVDVAGTPVTLITARIEKSLKSQGVLQQREQVAEIITALPDDELVVVAGDFNSTPHNATIFTMKEAMAYAEPEGWMLSTFTFPAEGRWYSSLGALIRIDHIFYRGLSLISSRVLDDSYGSDHYPVQAVFTVPETLEGER
jgi:endonuclease/exonuclease/phosphatase (EEP) superfamily protein YafD